MEQMTLPQGTRHVTAHCRTDPILECFHYVWTISDFWSIFLHVSTLTSDNIKEIPFTIEMKFDKSKTEACFHLRTDVFPVSYFMFLENVPNQNAFKLSTRYHENQLCYVLDISLLREQKSFVWNNALRIICHFVSLKTIVHKSICNVITEPDNMLPVHTDYSVSDKSSGKVMLVAFGEYFQARKDLLAARSTVFKSMFENNPNVDEFSLIEIDHVSGLSLGIFLSFLQTGHIVMNIDSITKATLHQLFMLANDYGVQDLQLLCECYMIKTLTHETAIESLALAYIYKSENLMNIVITYIKLHMKDMKNRVQFVQLLQEYPELLAEFTTDNLAAESSEFSVSDILEEYPELLTELLTNDLTANFNDFSITDTS